MVKTLNDLNAQSNMTNKFEFLDFTIVDRITELRRRLEDATTDLSALLEVIESPNAEVKGQVRLFLREAVDNIERALDRLEVAESAAGGKFEPKD
jgi:hypothetical protein